VLTGLWSTSALSIGRANLAASSLPAQALALFAGGKAEGVEQQCAYCGGCCDTCHVHFTMYFQRNQFPFQTQSAELTSTMA
jgi:hypothetical protein